MGEIKTVVAIYTGKGLAEPFEALFSKSLPQVRLVNIIDDSLIQDVIRAGGVPPSVAWRLIQYYGIAQSMRADLIVNTCSSVGDVVETGRKLVDVPIVRIDEPMADEAVRSSRNIAVLANLRTTLEPTMRLLEATGVLP